MASSHLHSYRDDDDDHSYLHPAAARQIQIARWTVTSHSRADIEDIRGGAPAEVLGEVLAHSEKGCRRHVRAHQGL